MANEFRWTESAALKKRDEIIKAEAEKAIAQGKTPVELFGTMPVAGTKVPAQSTTYWDVNGNPQTGYIKNGMTFTDEAMTQRVPVGATVQTAGGTFNMTDNGGVPTAATARNQFLQGTDAAINAYKAAGQIQNERINSATNAAIAELNRQKQIAGQNRQDADRAARDAYRAAANPFGAMEEQRVRLGLDNSGYAESSKLRLASDLAAQMTANQRAMNEQLRDIDVQIAEARAQGKYELANMLEARAQNIMQNQIAKQNTLYSTDMQAMNMAENTRQFNDQMALEREEIARAETRAKEENKYNLALTFLENGMDSDFVINTLGIPAEDVSAMASQIRNQRAQEAALAMAKATRSGSSGGGSPKPSKPVLTFAQVNDAIKNGRITPSVMSAYEYYYGAAYAPGGNETDYISMALEAQRKSGLSMDDWIDEYAGIWGIDNDEDIQALRMRAMGGGGAPAPTGGGMQTSGEAYNGFGAQYNSIFKSARDRLERGQSKADIVDYLDRFDVDTLSDAGYRHILEKLFKDER